NLKETLVTVFNIRPGEGLPTVLLLLHSFFIGVTLVYMETAAYALFLTGWEIENLPLVYIASALVTAAIGLIYSRLEKRLSFSHLLITTVALLAGAVLAFHVALAALPTQSPAARYVILCLLVWYSVTDVLIVLEFWGLSGRLLTVRQGKRLFGLIGSGQIAAYVVGGFSVSFFVGLMGTVHLLAFGVLGLAACLGILIYTLKKFPEQVAAGEEDEGGNGVQAPRRLSGNRYFRLILGVAAISIFGFFVVDYLYYNQLDLRFPDPDRMAAFLGTFIGAVGIVNLLGNLFLHSRLIERYGLGLGLLTVPVLTALGLGAALGANLGGSMALFFWFIVLTKGADEICRAAIEEPSFRILYQPFPAFQRMRVQTVTETIVEPAASAVIGALLFLFTAVWGFSGQDLLYPIWVVIGLWIAMALLLRKEFVEALTQALVKRRLGSQALSLHDAKTIDTVQKRLSSDTPGDVINTLSTLEEADHPEVERLIVARLDHPHPDVRIHVLQRIAERRITQAAKPLQDMLQRERQSVSEFLNGGERGTEAGGDAGPAAERMEPPGVLGEALRAFCAISEAEAYELVVAYLKDPDAHTEVKRGAMVGLLTFGGIDGTLAAGPRLEDLFESKKAEDRILAARILGEVGIATHYRPLRKLLEDSNGKVRSAALAAAGRLRNARLLPHLIRHLHDPEINRDAMNALIRFGERALAALDAEFYKEGQDRSVRIKVVRIMGRIGGDMAIDMLRQKIDFTEEEIRGQVLQALAAGRHQAQADEVEALQKRVWEEAGDATWALSVLVDIGDHEDTAVLARALKNEVDKNRRRIFSLLALIYPPSKVVQAQLNFNSNDRERRANALEILDNLLNNDLKNVVIPLMDDIPDPQRQSRLVDYYPQERKGRHDRLREILGRSQQWTTAWTRTCALFTVGQIGIREFHDAVVNCLADGDPVVRETAVWALGRLNPDDLVQRLNPMRRDPSRRVADYARFVINSVGFARIPMGKGGFLTRTGRYTVDLFSSILKDGADRRLRRCRAAMILSRFQVPAAREALVEGLSIGDKTVRTSVMDALVKGDYEMTEEDRNRLGKLVDDELSDAERILDAVLVFLSERHAARMADALSQEMNGCRRRLLSLLCLLHPDMVFVKASRTALFYWYVHQSRRPAPGTAGARLGHLIEKGLPDAQTADRVRALFRHRDPVALKDAWGVAADESPARIELRLRRIAFGGGVFALSWSRICAMELIVRLGLTRCVGSLVERLESEEEVIRATAAWALFRLDPSEFRRHETRLKNDLSPLVFQTAYQLADAAPKPDGVPQHPYNPEV
ncbi:MAG: HEAT repeat domain-containing protein, partial [Desulfococcaceae bacterium]